jgi:hypothetical protein
MFLVGRIIGLVDIRLLILSGLALTTVRREFKSAISENSALIRESRSRPLFWPTNPIGWDNQGFPLCFEHALGDLDPVRELPYRPAAVFLPHQRPDR